MADERKRSNASRTDATAGVDNLTEDGEQQPTDNEPIFTTLPLEIQRLILRACVDYAALTRCDIHASSSDYDGQVLKWREIPRNTNVLVDITEENHQARAECSHLVDIAMVNRFFLEETTHAVASAGHSQIPPQESGARLQKWLLESKLMRWRTRAQFEAAFIADLEANSTAKPEA